MAHRTGILTATPWGPLLVSLVCLAGTGIAFAGGHPHETAECAACHFGTAAGAAARDAACTTCHGTAPTQPARPARALASTATTSTRRTR